MQPFSAAIPSSVPVRAGVTPRDASAQDLRPAWAKPQPAWPFRVIDPQAHRPGAPAAAPAWST